MIRVKTSSLVTGIIGFVLSVAVLVIALYGFKDFFVSALNEDFEMSYNTQYFNLFVSVIIASAVLILSNILRAAGFCLSAKITTLAGLVPAFKAFSYTVYAIHDFYHIFIAKSPISITVCSTCRCHIDYHILRIIMWAAIIIMAAVIAFDWFIPKKYMTAAKIVLTTVFSLYVVYFVAGVPLYLTVWKNVSIKDYGSLSAFSLAALLLCLICTVWSVTAKKPKKDEQQV